MGAAVELHAGDEVLTELPEALPLAPGLNTFWLADRPEDRRHVIRLPAGLEPTLAGEVVCSFDDSVLLLVPPGAFTMHRPNAQAEKHRLPLEVTIERPFLLGKFEVSRLQYERFALEKGLHAPKRSMTHEVYPGETAYAEDDHPVNGVSQLDAKAYCEWAGSRLPTAAEWEYAACGGEEHRIYPWGHERDFLRTNSRTKEDGYLGTAACGTFALGVARWGHFDMVGNLWEWTQSVLEGSDFPTPITYKYGGSWSARFDELGTSLRVDNIYTARHLNTGFRVARDIGGGS